VLFVFLSWAPAAGAADQTTSGPTVEGLLDVLDWKELERFAEEVRREFSAYLPPLTLRGVIGDLQAGRPVLDPASLFSGVVQLFWKEVAVNAKVMGRLLVLAILCAVLHNLAASFERRSVGDLAYMVVLLALLALAVGSFSLAMQSGREAVDRMTSFMHALLPVLLSLMTALGGMVSSAVIHPLVLGSLALGVALVKNVVMPLLYFAAVLSVAGRLSERFPVTRLADTLRNLSVIALGLFVTLAVGVLAVQGVAAGAVDSLTLRTAKFASTAFVPVIGKTLTDAVEAVASASFLVQSAATVLGVVVLLALALFPAVKIGVLALMFQVTAALVQPFGDSRVSDTLGAMATALGLAFACVVAVGMFFFLALSIVAGLGNLRALWW
jgi:stage III sporulation protein AE